MFTAAAVQMNTGYDKMKSLKEMEKAIEEAAANGAEVICFPEMVTLSGRNEGEGGNAEPVPGLTSDFLSRKAKECGIYLLGGSYRTIVEGNRRYHNTALFFGPDGNLLSEYHKMFLFDADLEGGLSFRESDSICPGEEIVTADTPLGIFGTMICFDIRFPELCRCMTDRGARVIFMPADFSRITGNIQWELLVRTRALENQCFIIAADQCGEKRDHGSFGHSMIVDPYGKILAKAGEEPGIIYAQIDLCLVDQVRRAIPMTEGRKKARQLF